MSIIEKTRELGELIKDCPEMAAVRLAEEVQNKDEAAQELLKEYNLARMNFAKDMHEGKITQEDAIKQNQKSFEKIAQNEVIAAYIDAKKDFDTVVNEINNILNFYITGQDPSCTHDCGSCGGCH